MRCLLQLETFTEAEILQMLQVQNLIRTHLKLRNTLEIHNTHREARCSPSPGLAGLPWI